MRTIEELKVIDKLMAGHYILMFFEISVLPKIRDIHEIIKKQAKIKEYKQSGYLTVRDRKDGLVLLVMIMGKCPSYKAKKYLYLSLERGERLFHHPGHLSSWQSRDEKNKKQGGAIIAGDYIVSFAGICEMLDEAIVLALSELCRWLDSDKAKEIAEISSNYLYNYLK